MRWIKSSWTLVLQRQCCESILRKLTEQCVLLFRNLSLFTLCINVFIYLHSVCMYHYRLMLAHWNWRSKSISCPNWKWKDLVLVVAVAVVVVAVLAQTLTSSVLTKTLTHQYIMCTVQLLSFNLNNYSFWVHNYYVYNFSFSLLVQFLYIRIHKMIW